MLSELVAELRRIDPAVEIDVLTSRYSYRSDEGVLPPYEDWDGVRIHRVDAPSAKVTSARKRLLINLQFCRAVFKKLRQLHATKRYDVVLVSTAPPTLVSAAHAFRRLTGVPYVYILYDLDPDRAVVMKVLASTSLPVKVLRIAQRRWLRQAKSVVVLGRCMKEYVSETYQVPEERLEVIAIGCDPTVVPALPQEATAFRKKHGLDGFLLCYSGNFGRYHDFDTMLDAAKSLQQTDPTFRFALVGNGSQRPHIERRLSEEGITNVLLLPFVPHEEYPDLLASADASLVTLEPGMEGLCVPSKFYSILSSGRPTLAVMPAACEVARVIDEAECGVRIDVQDVEGMIDAVRRLAGDRERTTEMGRRARQTLETRYTTRQVAERYYSVLAQGAGISIESEGEDRAKRSVRVEATFKK